MFDVDLQQYVIYKCVIGSRAYGLEHEASDTDRRGFYLPPAKLHWSLAGVPPQLEDEEEQSCYWEIEKFIRLALKANPTILEVLFSPIVEHCTPPAQQLLDMRSMFLTRQCFNTHVSYADSQFRKMQRSVSTTGQIKWKHAMHLIRVMLNAKQILIKHTLDLKVNGADLETLLKIRNGEMTWEQLQTLHNQLMQDLNAANQNCTLPDRADGSRADDFLIQARKSMVDVI